MHYSTVVALIGGSACTPSPWTVLQLSAGVRHPKGGSVTPLRLAPFEIVNFSASEKKCQRPARETLFSTKGDFCVGARPVRTEGIIQ